MSCRIAVAEAGPLQAVRQEEEDVAELFEEKSDSAAMDELY